MSNSTSTRSRRSAAEPPSAQSRTVTDVATADPSTAPDQFAELARSLGTVPSATVTDVRVGPLPPPVEMGAQAVASAGWNYNQAITYLFAYDTPAGIWVFVNNVGWKRLSSASEPGVVAMAAVATMATNADLPVNYHEDAAGLIDQIYV